MVGTFAGQAVVILVDGIFPGIAEGAIGLTPRAVQHDVAFHCSPPLAGFVAGTPESKLTERALAPLGVAGIEALDVGFERGAYAGPLVPALVTTALLDLLFGEVTGITTADQEQGEQDTGHFDLLP